MSYASPTHKGRVGDLDLISSACSQPSEAVILPFRNDILPSLGGSVEPGLLLKAGGRLHSVTMAASERYLLTEPLLSRPKVHVGLALCLRVAAEAGDPAAPRGCREDARIALGRT